MRVGFLGDAGYLKLRDKLTPYLKAMFVVGYHVGARLGELLGLRWKQVDLANSQIVLDPGTTKSQKGRTLPIYGDMREWLLAQRAERDGVSFMMENESH